MASNYNSETDRLQPIVIPATEITNGTSKTVNLDLNTTFVEKKPIRIARNIDWNTLTTSGTYIKQAAANSSEGTNSPPYYSSSDWLISVIGAQENKSGAGTIQIAKYSTASSQDVWYRAKYGNNSSFSQMSWTEWSKNVQSSPVTSLNNNTQKIYGFSTDYITIGGGTIMVDTDSSFENINYPLIRMSTGGVQITNAYFNGYYNAGDNGFQTYESSIPSVYCAPLRNNGIYRINPTNFLSIGGLNYIRWNLAQLFPNFYFRPDISYTVLELRVGNYTQNGLVWNLLDFSQNTGIDGQTRSIDILLETSSITLRYINNEITVEHPFLTIMIN